MNIEVIAVGKIKESYFAEGIKEYSKRLSAFCTLIVVEVKEVTHLDTKKNVEQEADQIIKKIKDDDFVITLEIEGDQLSSLDFSNLLIQKRTYGTSKIVFVIGGSNGLSQQVKSRSNYSLSFGNMTFPHQMMRVILLEQLYRGFMIASNREYHK